ISCIKPYEFWTSDTGGFVTVFTNKDDCEVELKNDILEYTPFALIFLSFLNYIVYSHKLN
ncbi:MAG: hypothetical protein LBR10_02705, partial [Prevotellaceae bacterium]|nr:hypothetical protein [Prevotellaceae bacterium]